jgi:methyl-accepting chemotaxis protein
MMRTLRTKILSAFLVLAMMLATAGVFSVLSLKNMGVSVQGLMDQNYRSIVACQQMIEGLERADSGMLLILSGKAGEGMGTLEEAEGQFREGLEVAKNNLTIPGEATYVERVEEAYARYRVLWPAEGATEVREILFETYSGGPHATFLAAKQAVAALRALNATTMYDTASTLQAAARRALVPGIVAIVAALLFAVLFTYLIDYYMIEPMRRLTAEVRRIAEGGTGFEVEIESRDELWELREALSAALSSSVDTDKAG